MPNLQSASIKFHSNDDGRDSDTKLTITVYGGGLTAIKATGPFPGFRAHSDHTFNLPILSNVPKSNFLEGLVKIEIEPNGNDTWDFNYSLDLDFDDGSVLCSVNDGVSLNQGYRLALSSFSNSYLVPVPPNGPKVTACTIEFFTNGNNKDFDTHLTLTVLDLYGRVVGRIDNNFIAFGVGSESGIITFIPKNTSLLSDFETTQIAIRIDPVGNDTWNFNFIAKLHFGSKIYSATLTQQAQQVTLSQNNRIAIFHFSNLSSTVPSARLKAGSIKFWSGADGKDGDTLLDITFTDSNKTVVADLEVVSIPFESYSNTLIMPLNIVSNCSKADLQNGQMKLAIRPNGNDTWDFYYTFSLVFDDNSTLSGSASGITLSESNPTIIVSLASILTGLPIPVVHELAT